jgi:hypothetical protein
MEQWNDGLRLVELRAYGTERILGPLVFHLVENYAVHGTCSPSLLTPYH